MAYIEKPRRKSEGREPCLFCGLAKARPGVKNLLLAISPRALVMLNLYPYNVGHVMVAPRKHVGSLSALGPEDQVEVGAWLGRVETALRRAYRPHGFNVGINLGRTAGAARAAGSNVPADRRRARDRGRSGAAAGGERRPLSGG
jgi:hypothetical protein